MSATKDTLVLLSPTGEELESLAEAWEGTPEQVSFVDIRLAAYARGYAKAHTTGTGHPPDTEACTICQIIRGRPIDNPEFLADLVAANNYAGCLLFYAEQLVEELSPETTEAIEAIWNDEGPTDEQRALAAAEIEERIRDLFRLLAGFGDPEAEDEL